MGKLRHLVGEFDLKEPSSAFMDGSEWQIGTMRLNGAFKMVIDNIGEWSYSWAIPVWYA